MDVGHIVSYGLGVLDTKSVAIKILAKLLADASESIDVTKLMVAFSDELSQAVIRMQGRDGEVQ